MPFAHWGHELVCLLSGPPDTLSSAPSGGEGRGEEARFMGTEDFRRSTFFPGSWEALSTQRQFGFCGEHEFDGLDKASDKVSDKDFSEFLRTVLP
jgi:hypothetical protein